MLGLKNFQFKVVNKAVVNKLKVLRAKYNNDVSKNRSGAGRDTILKACPQYYELGAFLRVRHLTEPPVVIDGRVERRAEEGEHIFCKTIIV